MSNLKYNNTSDIKIPKDIVSQVIGQDSAVNLIKKAGHQRRNILLIGSPGTGKSMLGQAISEILPSENLVDVLAYENVNDSNKPLIRITKAGEGQKLRQGQTLIGGMNNFQMVVFIILLAISIFLPWYALDHYSKTLASTVAGAIMFFTFSIGTLFMFFMFFVYINFNKRIKIKVGNTPKIIIDRSLEKNAPFIDATGAHSGALFGDVLHDPLQSGGLGTPAHERVIGGMIHKAHKGVLFIDEIATLSIESQQQLLTVMQEKKFSITGQSEKSAGSMVSTEPVPCDFILVASGNLDGLKNLHPALRSRIRGYGYEVYMDDTIKETPAIKYAIAQFIAQEIKNDGKIPHFSKAAVEKIIDIARMYANRKNHITLRFRELSGVVRSSGDIAVENGDKLVEVSHIDKALKIAKPLEGQIAEKIVERKKEYSLIQNKGSLTGRVNGLAVIGHGTTLSGIILPIESEITSGGKSREILATGKLGEIAKESIINVSAIMKKYFGDDLKNKDIFVQFLQTYEGVEGDSASIAVATALISSVKNIPIKQNCAMTGSLSLKGEVLPIGGVSAKIKAAISANMDFVIIPQSNYDDIVLSKEEKSKIKIVSVKTILDVVEHAFDWTGKKAILSKFKKDFRK